jgi:4-carboxymuconolactone decarboxylase
MRSPQLLDRLQRVGEYIRYDSSLSPRLSEFAMLVVSRACTQQFEWFTHVPLALKAGTSADTIEAVRCGRRPGDMHADEALVYDFTQELLAHHGVCDATYAVAVERLGERGVIDLTGLVGYFLTVSLVLNVAHTPPEATDGVAALPALPL